MTRREILAVSARATLATALLPGRAVEARSLHANGETEPAAPVIDTLPDGATLVMLPEPSAGGVAWEAFFRVGIAEEGSLRGIRSLLTRCWIGDTEWRSRQSLAEDFSMAGASTGTACGPDWVEIWGTSAADSDSIDMASRALFTNIIAAVTFSQESVESARSEQMRAIALRRDNLLLDVLDQAQARAFGESPYAQNALGDEASVSRITPLQVERFYHRFFRPERAVFVVAGSITPDEARHRVTATLGAASWDTNDPPAPALHTPPRVSAPVGMRGLSLNRRAPAVVVAIAYLAPGISGAGRVDFAALQVLDAALRGGRSSRLFALRDRPEAGTLPIGYEIRTVLTPAIGQSLLTVYVAGDRPAAEVRDRLTAAIRAIGSGENPLTNSEIDRAKAYLIGRHRDGRQRLRERAFGAGWAETMGLGGAFDTDFELRIDSVGNESVARIARAVLESSPAVVFSRPLSE